MSNLLEPAWRSIRRDVQLLDGLDQCMAAASMERIGSVPDLRCGTKLIVGSDYGGHHKKSGYEAISFVFADLASSGEWLRDRKEFRRTVLRDGRRMAYKSLNDRLRSSALPQFLLTSSALRGLTVTLLIDKRIGSIFTSAHTESLKPDAPEFPRWNAEITERLLRVVHFMSFFLTGLCRSGQDVLWVTDEDAIVPNEDRVRDLCNVFGNVSSSYLDRNLGHFRLATTRQDSGDRQAEDLVAIPDLIAGALVELVTGAQISGALPDGGLVRPVGANISLKARRIGAWLSFTKAPLKHLAFAVEPDGPPGAYGVFEVEFPRFELVARR